MSQPKLLQAVGLLDLGLLEQTLKENPKSIHDHDEVGLVRQLASAVCPSGLAHVCMVQDGATALILAAEAGQFTMVSTLIGARSDVNAQTKVTRWSAVTICRTCSCWMRWLDRMAARS